MSRRRPTAIPASTPCLRCRRLECTIRAVMQSVVHLPVSGFQKSAGVAPLPPCYRKLLDETVNTFAVFSSCQQLLDCDDNCMLSVPLIKHERPSLQQMAKWRNLPRVIHWSLHVVVPRVPDFYEGLLSFFLVVLPTRLSARCLLSSRPETASIRSCLLLPPGFLDTREACI